MTKIIKSYADQFETAKQNMVKQSALIPVPKGLILEYSLPQITETLFQLYGDESFRNKFVGSELSQMNWTKGFCALTTMAVDELTLHKMFTIEAIYPKDWERGPVVFLRDNINNIPYDPTQFQFSPMRVPYELGVPVDRSRVRTVNQTEFTSILKEKLGRQ